MMSGRTHSTLLKLEVGFTPFATIEANDDWKFNCTDINQTSW